MTEVLNSSWVFALFHGYRFAEGFGKVTGSEYDSLFSVLLFTFIGDDVLIPIEQDRKRMQLMYADIFDNYREFKTKKWRSKEDFESIEELLSTISEHCDWFQQKLGDEVPGRGFNIEKYHKFLAWVHQLIKLGDLGNGDTSRFEQQIKVLKKVVANEVCSFNAIRKKVFDSCWGHSICTGR